MKSKGTTASVKSKGTSRSRGKKVEDVLLSNNSMAKSIYLDPAQQGEEEEEADIQQESDEDDYGNEDLFNQQKVGDDHFQKRINKNKDTQDYWKNIVNIKKD